MSQSIASVMDRIEAEQATHISIGPNATSLELLQAVYRNPSLPLPTRMRAAMAALPFETPKLMAVAQITEQSFAEILERRIQNYQRLQNGIIEAKPLASPVEVKPPMPRVADRRFRRI